MSNAISQYTAVHLAETYHVAMTLTNTRSSVCLRPGQSARSAIDAYLKACDVAGVRLHNDYWLEDANALATELDEKVAAVARRVFGAKV